MGRSPPAPPPRAHVSVCTVYIYIFVFIYIHTFTRFRHTPARRRPQVPPRRVPPRAHTCPCTHTSAHVCPRMQVHPRPPSPRTAQVCTPQVCMDPPPPQHPHGGRVGAPQSHNPPPQRVGAEGGPPRPPTKEHQPMGAPLWHPPSRAPPSRGGGACCTPQPGRDTLEGGVGDHRGTLGSVWGFFSNKDVKASRVQCWVPAGHGWPLVVVVGGSWGAPGPVGRKQGVSLVQNRLGVPRVLFLPGGLGQSMG